MTAKQERRRFTDQRLIVASHNPGKVQEINDLLRPFGVEATSAGELGLPEPVEDGDTFIANAQIKAHAAAGAAGLPALADDSGLAVDALDGAPGIFSARWAGPDKDFALAMSKVCEELQVANAPRPYGARFVCALCLAWPDGHQESFEGTARGALSFPPRGDKGFGYDPIFVPEGHKITFAQMEPTQKHAMSHRADAFEQLVTALF